MAAQLESTPDDSSVGASAVPTRSSTLSTARVHAMGKKKEEVYSVEKLVDVKDDGKKGRMFLVKWKGYPASQNTWEPVANLEDDCQDMMDALDKKKSPAKASSAKKPTPKKAKKASPAKGTANTRFMTTKPKRGGAGKSEAAAPAKEAPPAKKQKVEKKDTEKSLRASIAESLKEISDTLMAHVLGLKVPKAEKKAPPAKKGKEAAKEKPGGKRKRESEGVMEVDSIVGMRAKKGGIQYKILWKDGTQTWEPYDNVMDDDLIDDFEEARQIEVYGSASLAVGSEVEVKNVDEGFENSWSAAVVKKKEKGNKFTVEYEGFVDEDDEPVADAGLDRKRLRLAPPPADKGWEPVVGEIVEVNEDDCWWEASVEEVLPKSKLSLKFRVSDEVKPGTLGKKIRPCSWLTLEK